MPEEVTTRPAPATPKPRPAIRGVLVATVLMLSVISAGLVIRIAGASTAGKVGLDQWWFGVAHLAPETPISGVAVALHTIGSAWGVVLCITFGSIALLFSRQWREALTLITAGLFGVIGSETLKFLLARARPTDGLVFEHSFAYPSGHSMGAAVLATTLVLLVSRSPRATRTQTVLATCVGAAWILLMMWSRTALHAHWLTDTIAGALLGIAAALFASAIWLPSRPPRPSP